jgi:hypothetical protein
MRIADVVRSLVIFADSGPNVEEVNVVYVGHGGRLPARVRALIDFLAEEVDLDDALELLDTS